MRKTLILILTLFAVFTTVDARSKKDQDRALIDKVAMWQIDHQTKVKHHDLAWTNGVLFRGMVEWADYTQDSRYYDFLMQIGKKHRWGFLKRLYHADDLVIAQMYIRMYEKYHDPVMIQPTIARVDSIVAKPSKARLWLGAKNWSERWSWCDALFMAPPVYGQLNKLYPEKTIWILWIVSLEKLQIPYMTLMQDCTTGTEGTSRKRRRTVRKCFGVEVMVGYLPDCLCYYKHFPKSIRLIIII